MSRRRLPLGIFLSLLLALAWHIPAMGQIITDIEVRNLGAGEVTRDAVLAYLESAPGEEVSRAVIARDVKALERSGRFSRVDIQAEPDGDGLRLVVEIVPKAMIRSIEITGNTVFSRTRIRTESGLREGRPVDEAALIRIEKKLEKLYRDRFYYDAEVELTMDVAGDSGRADVRVDIEEGAKGAIGSIEFQGNEAIRDRVLKRRIESKTWNLLSIISKRGLYDPDILEIDLYRLREYYLSQGHLDVEIGDPEIQPTPKGKRLEITIPIEEGPVYQVNDVRVEGVEVLDPVTISNLVTLTSGEQASMAVFRENAQAIERAYNRQGYLNTRVIPDPRADLESRRVDVTFRVREGVKAYVRDILIEGNTATKDEVIRRELTLYPGDLFNEVKVQTSEARLRNLGYFSSVQSQPRPTANPEEYDLVLQVQEQKTGQFTLGVGFSSIDDLIGYSEVQLGNFNLFGPPFVGGGQKLRARLTLGTERRDILISFTEPWFLKRRLSLTVDAFQDDRRFLSDEYNQRNTGGRVNLGMKVGAFERLSIGYGLEEIDVYDVQESASELIRIEEGRRIKSAGRLTLTHDSRDKFFVSTRGNRSTLGFEYAGGLFGGDTDVYQIDLRSSQYVPLWFDHVLNLRGKAAVADAHGGEDRIPIFERLFLGGPRNVRAFEFRDVGPKDEDGEPVGGRSSGYATAEYIVPILPVLRGAAFYDAGFVSPDAYDFSLSEYNGGYGIGARIDIPGFPFRLDYAWPTKADEFNDSTGRFSFMIGYVF